MSRSDMQRLLLRWYRRRGRDFPWRRTRDPYRTLVAEVMLQQTQTSRVSPAYEAFLQRFPDVQSLADARPADVIAAWRGLGYNRRAIALHAAARAVVRDNDGRLPREGDALRRLPGVGPYTASALACFAFDAQVPVIDTNVRRVLARVAHGAEPQGLTPRELDDTAAAWLPQGRAYEWNQALMDVGALYCRSRSPACETCPLHAECVYRRAGRRPSPKKGEKASFIGSRRHARGAVVDVLRASPGGVSMAALSRALAGRGVSVQDMQDLLAGLERDGLVSMSSAARRGAARGRVRLPG